MTIRGWETYEFVKENGPVTSLDIIKGVGTVTPSRCVFEMREIIPPQFKLLTGRARVKKSNGKWVWVDTYKIVKRVRHNV